MDFKRICKLPRPGRAALICIVAGFFLGAVPALVHAQQASISSWQAADFRILGYIPYWASSTDINNFATNGMYTHVSDVLYFGGLRPDPTGNLTWASTTYQNAFNTIRSQAQTSGFGLHLSMFEVTNGQTDATWKSIIGNSTYRANFISQLKTVMQGNAGTADDLRGFNFDWERPDLAADWGNYTQLARELRAAINPLGMDVSVCDYGSTDTNWDDTTQFDAKVYDQLFMMVYHLSATSSASWADTKLALTQQGTAKAFSNDQIAIGIGTWGTGGPSTVTLNAIVGAQPNLTYDAGTFTGTIKDINGVTQTGTWTIESRKQVREKTQLALDRGMPGMFTWTLHYDALNNLGLHRVMQHYLDVKKDVPDLNLDGKIDSLDATTLANNMGMTLTNTGMTTAAQFDAFYLNGNWEKGDHNGDGFVNQADADWLASRYTALGVNRPDRLAYSGTFEGLSNSKGLNGRWRAARNAQNALIETSNFKQEATNFLAWSGTGVGATRRSDSFVTIRNQNPAEASANINAQARAMLADLNSPVDLGQSQDVYFTFLVKENTAPLSASQLSSANRKISLAFLNSSGADQFDFSILGLSQQLSILSQADAAGQDISMSGFSSNATYLIVGKLSGNGAAANSMQASLFANGANVSDFTSPSFPWMLTALSTAGYNPIVTSVEFTSPAEADFTVSNLWIGNAATIPEPSLGLICMAALPAIIHRALRPRRHRRSEQT